ncbi:DUF4091 domain-containing protein [Paenibacillus sp. LHD-117]|uniref:DUF4091 domain-containing protein n=1 Tax=Paenibacillus sp. LHD-117 TaxID=3071412 RepID=UPI0027E1ED49|nr:DUF4091 domain-containing protein [Paenibacillus sp. LHD-117]MDQ6421340.1 DUF4091 domain-containing protein [Paenibacillus sp. LHD-117]
MTQQTKNFATRCLSSLSKVFPDEVLTDEAVQTGSAMWNETFSFQAAYCSSHLIRSVRAKIEADSELLPFITVRSVGLSPSELPVYDNPDANYIRTTPGLYPDPLYPLEAEFKALPGQWRSLWLTVRIPSMPESVAFAKKSLFYEISVSFLDENGENLGKETFTLEIIPVELPTQKLIHTEWFHADCIATQYGVDAFSERHWELLERYARNAAEHGVNMLLTPLFTPPLDTAVGEERLTMQLIDVDVAGENEYAFGFGKLERWIDMCRRAGIHYFECSHLFTQWGAAHAPKIMAKTPEGERRIFGWETDAAGECYEAFLDAFLPKLTAFIRSRGMENDFYFHVSDEPVLEQLEAYRRASDILKKHLKGFRFLDALSDYAFYEQGLVEIPVPANDHMDRFLEGKVDPLWTYYCCAQHRDVSNRFFAMPSARNRIIGMQMYKFGIQGFLHWGYNFWYSQGARRAVDPYKVTDADCAFASGDAFVVYPGPDGPIDSIRWEVFREALQDQRALELLEALAGREKALALLEEETEESLQFKKYPVRIAWLLGTRRLIHEAILKAM